MAVPHGDRAVLDSRHVEGAAAQVGRALQLAVIEDKPEYITALPPEQVSERQRRPVAFHVIVNPQISRGSLAEPSRL